MIRVSQACRICRTRGASGRGLRQGADRPRRTWAGTIGRLEAQALPEGAGVLGHGEGA